MLTRVIIRILALLGLSFLLLIVAAAILVVRLQPDVPTVPDRAIVELDLRAPLVEPGDSQRAAPFARERIPLHRAVRALRQAAGDDRVEAVFARVDGASQGLATSQDLHDALDEVRAAGKPTVIFADTFGELGNGTAGYFLATGFDEIWLQPVGLLGLTGLAADIPFLADALAAWGIEAEVGRRTEYKTAMDSFAESGMTDAHREMMETLFDDLFEQIVDTIGERRGLDPGELRDLIDRAPLTAEDALTAELIDHIGHGHQAREALEERLGNGTERIHLRRYEQALRAEETIPDEPRFALVHGNGPIVRGNSTTDPLTGEKRIGADSFATAVIEAIEDDVDAIVVRINSPGGSAVASETARHALARAREAGIPVIVSMGGVAASGGYWIAVESDAIIARPAALTGSIGVVAGKLNTAGLWERLEINWEQVARGEHAGMLSPIRPFEEGQRAHLEDLLDSLYDDFKLRVADGRELNLATVDELARGRVWTGRQAEDSGLIDGFGGLHEAYVIAREHAGIDEDVPVRVDLYPAPLTPLEQLFELLSGNSPLAGGAAERRAQLRDILSVLGDTGRGTRLLEAPRGVEAP